MNKVYQTALNSLGQDISPLDLATDELGCAETITNLLRNAGVKAPIILGTYSLFEWLQKNCWRVSLPLPGNIVISPTGLGGRNGITHGHTGIVLDEGKVASSDSKTGKFIINYTIKDWIKKYVDKGGYPMYFFAVEKPQPVVPKPVSLTEEQSNYFLSLIAKIREAILKLRG